MKISTLNFSISILFVLIFVGCTSNESKTYPPQLAKAIDYFYTENQNQKALSELDSIDIKSQSDKTARMIKLFTVAALCELEKVDSAEIIFKSITDDTRDDNFTFWYNSIQGLLLFRKDKLSDAYEVLSKTLAFKNTDLRALGIDERLLARISLTLGDQDKGLEWLLLSTKHFEQAGYKKSVGINYKLVGRYYVNAGNYEDALLNFRLAEKILKKYNDKSELFYVYINFIDCYLHTKDLDKARYYANICLTECKDVLDNLMLTLLYNNMGEIELSAKNYNAAINYFNMTLQTPPDYSTIGFRRANAHIKLAKIYRLTNNTTEALAHAQQARSYLPQNDFHLIKYETFDELAEDYRLTNSSDRAFRMLDTARMHIDSAYNTVSKTTKDFYETKSKLVDLSNNMERLKEKERKHRNVYLTIIVGLTALFIFAFIIYRLQHSKTKVLKVLVEKNLQIIEDERKLHASLQQQADNRKPARRNNDQEKHDFLYINLQSWLETNKQFARKDLSLELVAKELNTNREYLSRAISEQNIRFNDLINKYRVQEAIQILSDKNNRSSRYSLSAIASEVGFNSNSVFIDAFRKQTGMNPAQFRNNLNSTEIAG
jgi:AraC-like DNA-binding protein